VSARFDTALLERLACPGADHAPLKLEKRNGGQVLVCTACRSTFPIEDGIAVLLIDEATPGPHGVGVPV